jgi:hypothetical protein
LPFREALAQAPGAHLRVYDFHRFARYPGDELFRDMGVGDRITRLPRGMIINPRLPPETVRANYRKLYARLADAELPAFLTLDESAERARRTQITRLLKERFAGVNERLLAACAVPATPGAVAGPTERRRA